MNAVIIGHTGSSRIGEARGEARGEAATVRERAGLLSR
jgi:hypothetical protein